MLSTSGRTLALAALLFAATISARAETTLDQQWQAANGAYKVALQASSLGKASEALAALATFRTSWSRIGSAFPARPPRPYADDRHWSADVAAVGRWAQKADAELRSGRLPAAHETLEQVRLRWMAMRLRNAVAYFGDRLTSFHEPMETVALAVKGHTAATLTDRQVAVVGRAAPLLRARWARVAGFPHSTPSAERDALVQDLSMAVDELEAAARAGDRVGIVSSGSRLKPLFARLYMQFG